jgi:hypothetical protein
VEPVELSVLEVLEASGPVPTAAAAEDKAGAATVAAGTTGSASAAAATGTGTEAELLPNVAGAIFLLNLPAFALGVEGRVNQMVEVFEAVVHERVLQVII